jgi:hypothetical protein
MRTLLGPTSLRLSKAMKIILALLLIMGLVMTSGTVLSASKALEQTVAKQTSSESAPALDSLQCVAGLESKVAKILGHSDIESYHSACMVMPSDTKKSIVALLHKQEVSETDSNRPDDDYYDLDVLVVEFGTEKVLSHLFQKKAYTTELVMSFGSIEIDTGRYKLAPGVRAFGVRVLYEHDGATWFNFEVISLFVMQGNKLKQVLDNLEITSSSGDKYFGDDEQRINCMESGKTEGTLAIDNTISHGYADLLLRERTVAYISEMNDNGCAQKKVSHSRRKLRFNGDVYQ